MLFFINHTKKQYICIEYPNYFSHAFEMYRWTYEDDIGTMMDIYEHIEYQYYKNIKP